MRRIPESQEHVKSGAWAKGLFQLTTTLAGKKVGIVGMGRIGQDLAKRLEPFKVEIAYSGPNPKPVPSPNALWRSATIVLIGIGCTTAACSALALAKVLHGSPGSLR